MHSRDQPGSTTATGTWHCLLVLVYQTSRPSFNIDKLFWYTSATKVNIRTQRQQNWWFTDIQTVKKSNEKLPPLLIF